MTTKARPIQIRHLWLLSALVALVLLFSWSASLVYAQDRGDDRDGDGVPDAKDACPDEAGPQENGGCPVRDPDSDGDGLSDSADRCPREAGPADNGGCPRPAEPPPAPPPATDSDGDGLTDDVDRCPRESGLRESGSCLAGRSEGSEETRDESALPQPEVAGPLPALIPPLGKSNGPCVAATGGGFNVNIRGAADPNAVIQGSLDPGSVTPVGFAVARGDEVWLTVEGGFVSRDVVRLGGDCANLWTVYDGSVVFLRDSVSAASWPASADSGEPAHRLTHVVQYGGQPIAMIGGSEALTVGGSQENDVAIEEISFVYEQIKWDFSEGDPDMPIILGGIYTPDEAPASGDLASADCQLLPDMENITCQPGQPYMPLTRENIIISNYSISVGGSDAAADIDALGVVNTPLIVVPDTVQPGGSDDAVIDPFMFDLVGMPHGSPSISIGMRTAASGRGPSLLIGGDEDLLIGGTTTFDQTVHVLQLFALVDAQGAFLSIVPDAELPDGTTAVHVGEIVVIGDEEVIVVADQSTPSGWVIYVLPTMESKEWIELQSYQWGVGH